MKKLFYWLLSMILALVLCVVLLICWPLESAPLVGKKGSYIIENANVVDVKNGVIHSDMTVLTKGAFITDIFSSNKSLPRQGSISISARGKYIIPGLWDMHTHSYKISPQIHHPLYISNGVTGVRDLSGCMDQQDSYWACINDRVSWTNEASLGIRVSPRYVLQSSYQTNGGNEVPNGYPPFFKLETRHHAQTLTFFYKSAGADFIKTYSELSIDQYQNLADAVSESDIYIAGHKPIKVTLDQAIDAKQKSIEHARLFLFECYKEIASFRKMDNPIQHYNTELMRRMLNQQDEKYCQSLMKVMAKSDTWWVPTLTTLQMSAFSNNANFRDDARLDEVPYVLKAMIWFPDADRAVANGYDNSGQFVHRTFFNKALHQVGAASNVGVKLLAGTDAGDTYVFAGSSLHDELAMFVDAGISPLAALQAATISAAKFSDLEDKFGSVEVGKAADLVLLDENPLENINNTRKIFGVMQNGIYYDRRAVRELTEFVEGQANSIQLNVRYLWNALYSPLMRQQIAD